MENTQKQHICTHCDYTSAWKHNLTRHMVTKHHQPNVNVSQPNVNVSQPNVSLSKECSKCRHVFAQRCIMLKHLEKCNGLSTLACAFCKKIYASRQSKYQHLRVCAAKKEAESKALINVSVLHLEPKAVSATGTNISITGNNIVNNIQNNNITQNITLVLNPTESLLFDHISKRAMKSILDTYDDSEKLSNFSEKVLKRKENLCVRKTNLKSASSLVHIGNDLWEARTDKQIMPKLMSSLAHTFNESMDMHNIEMANALKQFIEDVECDGEHDNDDDEEIAHMQRLYKRTMNNVKHILFNITKQTIGEEKAKAMLEDRK